MIRPAHVGGHLGGFHADIAAVLLVSTLAGAALCGLAVVAYRRRRSRSYLLVVVALAALLARPLVALGSSAAMVSAETHHLIEHALDTVFVALVLAAVYYTRSVEKRLDEGEL
ncbi:DUF7471 family protein [Haloarcula salina]|uniref:DUF7471 family protein n=1 Tax=Haloarcula salina TaxID=1429914 RepID=UPI0020B76F17|nr:hypothetical protein [Haloarcula salina]